MLSVEQRDGLLAKIFLCALVILNRDLVKLFGYLYMLVVGTNDSNIGGSSFLGKERRKEKIVLVLIGLDDEA